MNDQGFYFQVYIGGEIHQYVENCKNPAELPLITSQLQEGEKVFVNILGAGWCKGIVAKWDEGFYAETSGSICPLNFDTDDRHCWTCSSALNKHAIQTTRLRRNHA